MTRRSVPGGQGGGVEDDPEDRIVTVDAGGQQSGRERGGVKGMSRMLARPPRMASGRAGGGAHGARPVSRPSAPGGMPGAWDVLPSPGVAPRGPDVVGTGSSLVARSGISLIATAATTATIEPATPSQKVWAVARLNAAWMPSTSWSTNGRDGRERGHDDLAEVTDAGELVQVERARAALGEAASDLRWHAGGEHLDGELFLERSSRRSCRRRPGATVPPIWRKNVRLDVATPSWRNGTAFWMTMVKTENVGPTPRPTMNIHSHTTGHRRVLGQLGHEQRAQAHDRDRADEQPLVAAGPRHDQAGHDGAADEPDHERQSRQARSRSGEKPSTTWNQRGRKTTAPKKAKAAKNVETIDAE